MVEGYLRLASERSAARVAELGIRQGGSTALLADLFEPERLVAFELVEGRAPALDAFTTRRGLGEVIKPYYGVDQADRAAVAAIADQEFGAEGIDLVLDDASHLLDPTRASFEVLFPRVRPGGVFVLEDWNADHLRFDGLVAHLLSGAGRVLSPAETDPNADGRAPVQPPLSRLVVELLLARASAGSALGDITLGPSWVVVERGPAELDPDRFRLSDLYTDHFGMLPALDPSATG